MISTAKGIANMLCTLILAIMKVNYHHSLYRRI